MLSLFKGRGYIPRDYKSVPEFSAYPELGVTRLPRSQWKERVEYLNEIQGMPYHWHKQYAKIRSQSRYSYCWMYGTVCAVETSYAMQGVGSPHLNAHAAAYRGKRGANRGGFGVEACRYIQASGIPQESVLAGYVKQRSWSPEVQANADLHKLVDFHEIGSNDFEGCVSALIGENPQPITLALRWWRHLVCGLGVAIKGNDVGLIIANSHGTRYSAGGKSGGYGILWGRKAVSFESVAVRHVKARSEV